MQDLQGNGIGRVHLPRGDLQTVESRPQNGDLATGRRLRRKRQKLKQHWKKIGKFPSRGLPAAFPVKSEQIAKRPGTLLSGLETVSGEVQTGRSGEIEGGCMALLPRKERLFLKLPQKLLQAQAYPLIADRVDSRRDLRLRLLPGIAQAGRENSEDPLPLLTVHGNPALP